MLDQDSLVGHRLLQLSHSPGGPRRILTRLSVQAIISLLVIFIDGFDKVARVSGGPARNSFAENALLACYNKEFNVKGSTFADYMNGRPSRSLRLHQVWWSTRPADLALSFFTPADTSRLSSLQAMCRSLPGGSIVAAVWLPLVMRSGGGAANASASAPGITKDHQLRLSAALATLNELFAQAADAPPGSSCVLRLLLLYELVADDALGVLMPVNALRNAAMVATDSPLVAMLDVDLSANAGLARKVLLNQSRATELRWRSEQQHVAWVLPAWDTAHHMRPAARNDIADVAVSIPLDEKYRLRDMWTHRKLLYPFAFERGYTPGHNATNYERWFISADDYPVEYQEGYEPWFITARKVMPLYDARFRGYYMNKVVATRHASHLLNLRVLRDAWIVHRPHEVQVSNFGWLQSHRNVSDSPLDKDVIVNGTHVPAREAFFERNRYFYKDAVKHMANWSYVPVVDVAAQYCRTTLVWWAAGS